MLFAGSMRIAATVGTTVALFPGEQGLRLPVSMNLHAAF